MALAPFFIESNIELKFSYSSDIKCSYKLTKRDVPLFNHSLTKSQIGTDSVLMHLSHTIYSELDLIHLFPRKKSNAMKSRIER